MMDGTEGMGSWGLVWTLAGFAVLLLAILASLWVILTLTRGNRGPHRRGDAPEEILRRRYANGEIDEDEYLRRQAGLH